MNIYWYISKAKLDLLVDQAPGFLTGIKAEMSFKLPMVGGSLSGTEPARLAADLQRVIKKLKSGQEIPSFSELADGEAPMIVAFEGPAMRQVSDDVFWLAMEQGDTGLLLAGSAAFAIGGSASPQRFLSPSADPVGAVKAAFVEVEDTGAPKTVGGTGMTLSGSLSYAWQELMAESLEGTLPKAGGLAIYARTVNADPTQVRRIGSKIRRIVVASPIYVQQV